MATMYNFLYVRNLYFCIAISRRMLGNSFFNQFIVENLYLIIPCILKTRSNNRYFTNYLRIEYFK